MFAWLSNSHKSLLLHENAKYVSPIIIRLYRAIVNIFDARKKDIAKWLKNCEKKEKEIPKEVQDLDQALIAVTKIQVHT